MHRSFSLLLPPLIFAAGTTAFSKELEGVYAPTNSPCPSVEEAIAKMKTPDGYDVRCFASEPMIINPVAMTWDHRGRLWVVELYEYPTGAKNPNEYSKTATDEKFRPVVKTDAESPRDRVIVLEDTDNDGKADKRTVFAESLSLATAIQCGYGGVFVGQAPNMFFFKDTDGDDKADIYKTVLTGFGLEDRHELLNSFTWGPDGAMYFTHGVFTHSRVRRPGEADNTGNVLNAGIYRVRFGNGDAERGPWAQTHEVYSDGTSNPWGVDFDARGNAFVEACVIDHLFHMAPGGIYARQGGSPENPYAYELLPSIVPQDHARHLRAAYAGIQIYQGGVYPADTHGHLFFGNIHDNAIHEEAVDPAGATFKARIVRDFLRANDGWFRPVSVQTGPDGFLWVMDWCDKYPCYQNAQANPGGVDREKGRIWRVCYTGNDAGKKLAGMSRTAADLDISKLSPDDLVAGSVSDSSWLRTQARRRIVEEPTPALKTKLEEKFQLTESAREKNEAFITLCTARLMEFKEHTVETHTVDGAPLQVRRIGHGLIGTAAEAADPVLRLSAARAAQELQIEQREHDSIDHNFHPAWKELSGDADPQVRHAVMAGLHRNSTHSWTGTSSPLGAMPGEDSAKYAEHIKSLNTSRANTTLSLAANASLRSTDADPTLALAIWQAIEPWIGASPEIALPWLADLAPKTKPLSQVLAYKSARRITDTRSAEKMDLLLAFLDKIKDDDALTAHALDGMLKAQEAGALKPAKTDPAPLFAHWQKSKAENVRTLAGRLATLWGDPNAVAALMGTVLDEKADVNQRIEAIRTVRRLKSDAARTGMLKLLESKSPDVLTVETLRAAGELGGGDLVNAILKAWEGYSPALRTAAAEVLATRADWSVRLLDAVEGKWIASGKISAADIPVTVRRSLAQNKDLAERAQTLLGAWNESGDDVKALIAAKKKAALTGEPNLENGKLLFTATCATCHTFHGGGQEVGPELIGSGRSNLDALLANVIDPNQIIGNGYENFIVSTNDGRAVAGRVVEDTPTQMTLLGIGGVKTVVPRGEIKEALNTHQSLMPMGFGGLDDADFRDLVWYILAPPDEGPLTPEKKEHFTRSIDETAPAKDGAAAPKPAGSAAPELWNPKQRDRESASLWSPGWELDAADFEGTPTKLVDYHGRKNVLVLHPKSKTEPGALVRTLELPKDTPVKLSVRVASHDDGDWELRAFCNGEPLSEPLTISHGDTDKRWRKMTWDLAKWQGQRVTLRMENHASGWMNEFSFWSDPKID